MQPSRTWRQHFLAGSFWKSAWFARPYSKCCLWNWFAYVRRRSPFDWLAIWPPRGRSSWGGEGVLGPDRRRPSMARLQGRDQAKFPEFFRLFRNRGRQRKFSSPIRYFHVRHDPSWTRIQSAHTRPPRPHNVDILTRTPRSHYIASRYRMGEGFRLHISSKSQP